MRGKSILDVLIVIVFKFIILGWLFAQLERAGLSRWGSFISTDSSRLRFPPLSCSSLAETGAL